MDIKWKVPILFAAKDIFAWLATVSALTIRADPLQFIIYATAFCGQSIISNILMYNHLLKREQ